MGGLLLLAAVIFFVVRFACQVTEEAKQEIAFANAFDEEKRRKEVAEYLKTKIANSRAVLVENHACISDLRSLQKDTGMSNLAEILVLREESLRIKKEIQTLGFLLSSVQLEELPAGSSRKELLDFFSKQLPRQNNARGKDRERRAS